MKTKLNPDTIYLGDNGRAFCGALRCAGVTAHGTGRDLSGQPVAALPHPNDIRHALSVGIQCECCGKAPRLVIG